MVQTVPFRLAILRANKSRLEQENCEVQRRSLLSTSQSFAGIFVFGNNEISLSAFAIALILGNQVTLWWEGEGINRLRNCSDQNKMIPTI